MLQSAYSQSATEKIIIVKYSLYPYSTEYFDHDSDTPSDKKSFDIALRRTKEYKYTLMSDFKSEKAVFYLDTVINRPIKGKESYWIEPENVVSFSFKKDNNYYKKESVFNNNFYVFNTRDFSYDWTITNENRVIAGFNCTKAISNVKNNKVIAWFANDIPINYSPLNLNGLPGLILEVENFFNTITIESISYSEDTNLLDTKLGEVATKYHNEKGGDEIKESILMLKKAQLISQLKMMR